VPEKENKFVKPFYRLCSGVHHQAATD